MYDDLDMPSLHNIEGIRCYCLSLPCVTEDFPFDETTLVFRVGNKIFGCVDLEHNDWLTLKCNPDYAIELREAYNEISGAWHWNKKYWNQIHITSNLTDELIASLIRHSYDEVVKNLPRSLRMQHPEMIDVGRQLRIEPTCLNADWQHLQRVFASARQYMATHGNPTQWADGYPSKEQLKEDCEAGGSYVCRNNMGRIVATFCFIIGDDPTYNVIRQGEWLNDKPYGVVHRMASDGSVGGVGVACMRWCLRRCPNMRVDTHADNGKMRQLLDTLGFTCCGFITCHNGTERLAYQKDCSIEE